MVDIAAEVEAMEVAQEDIAQEVMEDTAAVVIVVELAQEAMEDTAVED